MRFTTTLIALLVAATAAWGQISVPGTPPSFATKTLSADIASVFLPPVDVEEQNRIDFAEESQGLPPRFGVPFDVSYDLSNSGQWETYPGGGRLWRLRVASPGAKSINLCYSNYRLPEGAQLYIYSSDRKHVIGAFTSANNKPSGGFATGLVFGDDVVVEYYEPAGVDFAGSIEISRITHGYRYIDGLLDMLTPDKQAEITNDPNPPVPMGDAQGAQHRTSGSMGVEESFGDSGACQVNINCPEGSNWQDEKRAVAMIVVDGFRWCSGSLMNNVRQDLTPYFLTADHCLTDGYDAVSNPIMTNWSFYWMYEVPGCVGGSDFTPPITNGATLVSNDSPSDYALLLLTGEPRLGSRCQPLVQRLGRHVLAGRERRGHPSPFG